jgi:hypothetical protein
MSLTENDTVFAGVSESALNDVLSAFLTARAHYLHHGSPPLVTADSAAVTRHDPLTVGGTTIAWRADVAIPRIDLFPDSSGALPPEITVAAGQFTLRTSATFTVQCGDGQQKADLDLWALGSLAADTAELRFEVARVELVDITPTPLENLLECLLTQVLRGLLGEIRLPLDGLRAGAFALVPTRPLVVDDDRVKFYGRV